MVLDVFDVVFDEVERDFRVVAEFAELNAAPAAFSLTVQR
jgi:hypothetical protein